MKPEHDTSKFSANDFMLKEYDRINMLWVDENNQAERRVNFFLSISSATIGAIVLIFQLGSLSVEVLQTTILAILVFYFFFGITVLNRLNTRTVQIRAIRNSLDQIQQYFADKAPEVAEYLHNQKGNYFVPDGTNPIMRLFQSSFTGGLNDLMIYANSMILGGISLVILLGLKVSTIFIVMGVIATVLISWKLLQQYCNLMVKVLRPWLLYKFR